jgi:hypothetical protein
MLRSETGPSLVPSIHHWEPVTTTDHRHVNEMEGGPKSGSPMRAAELVSFSIDQARGTEESGSLMRKVVAVRWTLSGRRLASRSALKRRQNDKDGHQCRSGRLSWRCVRSVIYPV